TSAISRLSGETPCLSRRRAAERAACMPAKPAPTMMSFRAMWPLLKVLRNEPVLLGGGTGRARTFRRSARGRKSGDIPAARSAECHVYGRIVAKKWGVVGVRLHTVAGCRFVSRQPRRAPARAAVA